MSKRNDGGPAYPVMDESGDHGQHYGISFRDLAALKAMAALMPIYWETQSQYGSAKELVQCQVESAYQYADAMLKQREK